MYLLLPVFFQAGAAPGAPGAPGAAPPGAAMVPPMSAQPGFGMVSFYFTRCKSSRFVQQLLKLDYVDYEVI